MSKPKPLRVRPVQRFGSPPHYRFAETAVQLEHHDTDIKLLLPSGASLLVQYRIEGESVDVFYADKDGAPKTASIYVYEADLRPAKKRQGALQGEQIILCL